MKKIAIIGLDELKETLENEFNCSVKFSIEERIVEGEVIVVDIVEFHFSKVEKELMNLRFPYVYYKNPNLFIVEFSDLHYILNHIYDIEFIEIYDFIEEDSEEKVLFYIS